MKNQNYRIGDVYMMRFSGTGSEQSGWRPGLVFQNNTGNRFSPNIIALPMTTAMKKTNLPTHVVANSDQTALKQDSMILCENPQRMSKSRIGDYLTTLPKDVMKDVVVASLLATSAIGLVTEDDLLAAYKKAVRLNAVQ